MEGDIDWVTGRHVKEQSRGVREVCSSNGPSDALFSQKMLSNIVRLEECWMVSNAMASAMDAELATRRARTWGLCVRVIVCGRHA